MKSYIGKPTVNAGSMADIAFLLLIFFLVTTTILQEKGLLLKLPPPPEQNKVAPVNERNIFKIRINSLNKYLVEGEVRTDLAGVKEQLKHFILNHGEDPTLSENPKKAIISIKADRGANYKTFISALDQAKGAYYEIYGERVGITADEYRRLDHSKPSQFQKYQVGKAGIPMNISIAEPNS